MKKGMLTLTASLLMLLSIAQDKKDYNGNSPAWFIEVNANKGALDQFLKVYDLAELYPMSVNSRLGGLTFSDGTTFGINGQLGYFFGSKRNFGLGIGVMYFSCSGNIRMSSFHMEYKATDFKNDVFRQIITANQPVEEKLEFTSVSVPLVVKFQHRFAKRWAFTADAGVVYNVQNKYTYSSSNSFDYEAIYKFVQSGNSITAVYDQSPTPGKENWLITKAHYESKNPDGNVETYFKTQEAEGYSVGLNKKLSRSGEFSYEVGALGFIIQPAISLMVSDKFALNIGIYYMSQKFTNNHDNNYQLVDNKGGLNTLLGTVENNATVSYGCTFGARLYIGK